MARKSDQGAAAAAPEFVLRDLSSDDVFTMTSLIGKLGISNIAQLIDKRTLRATRFETPTKVDEEGNLVPLPVGEWTEKQKAAAMAAEDARTQLTLRIVETVLNNFERCRDDVYRLLASGYTVSVDDIRGVSAVTLISLIDGYINREAFADFFTQALKLMAHMGRFGSKMNSSGDMVPA